MPANRLQRSPSLVARGDTVYVAATVYPITGTAIGARQAYVARIPGGPVAAPPGEFQFVYPKVVAAATGGVHMVWAEFDSLRRDVMQWSGSPKTTLWHAAFARGKWSPPEEILRAPALEWPKNGGNVAVDDAGRLHVVVWSWGAKRAGVVHVRQTARGWRVDESPFAPLSRGTAVDVHGDSVVVAFVSDSFEPTDTAGVSVAVSTDGGASWGPPRVIRRMGSRRADHLRILRVGGRRYLTWAEASNRRFGRDTLRAVRLDASLRPDPVASIGLPAGTSSVDVTAACGQLVFLVETLSQVPRTFEGSIAPNGVVSMRSFRPDTELAAFSGLGATSTSVVLVSAIRPVPGTPARAVVVSRPACPIHDH